MRKIYQTLFILLCACSISVAATPTPPAPKPSPITLTITGIKGEALKNAQQRLDAKKKVIYVDQPNIVRWHFYQTIPKEVKTSLQPYGYFKAQVHTTLQRNGDVWLINVVITPGQRLKFTRINVKLEGDGKKDRSFVNYLKHLPIQPGKNFNSINYEKTKDALQDIANTRGYFSAKLTSSKLVVDLRNYTSTVTIIFNTGPRYKFGATIFSPSKIKRSLLEKYLTYYPGQYYNSQRLEKSRLNLTGSTYFQQVVMTPEVNQANRLMVPIATKLYAADQVQYTMGVGYGTDTKIRGLLGMDIRWLNSSGHSLKVLLRGSQLNNELSGNYIIPAFNPVNDFFSINAGLTDINQVTGTGKSAQAGIGYQTLLWGWHVSAAFNYLYEKYNLKDYPIPGHDTRTNANILYPRLSIQRTVAKKNMLNPSKGYNIMFFVAGASKSLGSKTTFSQYRLDAKFLYTLPTHTRVIVRTSLGVTNIKHLEKLPLSMQFYAGGATSIRGFQYNSIGPGRVLAIGSFELQQRIIGKFYLAGFIDAGNVATDIMKHKAYVGSGPGLVYLTPVGAFEISLAKDLRSKRGPWKIQFSMGVLL